MILALPKGRILEDITSLLPRANIHPEDAFYDENSRQLRFTTNMPDVDIIRVRAFDVATFVAFGVAHLGIVGLDVLMEFDYPEIYVPLDLNVGRCRIVVAEPHTVARSDDPIHWSHVRVATKYPRLTQRHFVQRGVQVECIKLNGAVELATSLGLCERIVDLVSTGRTLKNNGLTEVEKIADVSSRLIINRAAWKTMPQAIAPLISQFEKATTAAKP
ncbi:MAG: ATP phosphoribosyltransferase [Alphaproteobacteria bacterium GM202ARS2]|nr:ATP phosphoribosyltransferase [Alphaproteobacteria bacterium GM202ARS2]